MKTLQASKYYVAHSLFIQNSSLEFISLEKQYQSQTADQQNDERARNQQRAELV